MKKRIHCGSIGLVLFLAFTTGITAESPPVTTGTLFEEMIDLSGMGRFPEPAFRTVQFSSFDRLSRVPGGPDWFANADGFGGEPIPNFEKVLKEPQGGGPGEYLMADVAGPGAIVRLWTASIDGLVRVYVDDGEKPLYDGPADPFFRRPYDVFPEMKAAGENRFKGTVYQADASYAPIPFAKRLRVIWIGKIEDIHFYQIQVRKYAPGTKVETFRPEDIVRFKEKIDRVTTILSEPGSMPLPGGAKPAVSMAADLAPGGRKEALKLEGPGALGSFWIRLEAKNTDKALRQTVLSIVCDGFPRGQVESPVGDFFGAAPGINPYTSLPFSVGADGRMTCRFIMPFAKSLSLVLENRGDQPVRITGEARPAEFAWDDRAMHFLARWRVDHGLVASGEDVQDLPFLLARGRGVYAGTVSFLLNPAAVPTPWGGWWGEGDEKVFVDDDLVPSIFGTGSEDYYNYSWSSPDIFFFPYCGQPRNDGPGNRGFVTNFRWQIPDRIPFEKSIDFRMELCSHERTPGLSYARIGYYYARPGTIDDHMAIKPDDLREPALPDNWQPAARFGARDSVFFPAEEIIAGRPKTRLEDGRLWAGGRLLVWEPSKDGERMKLRIRVDKPGKNQVHLTAALTPASGTIAAWIESPGQTKAAAPLKIDLYEPYRILSRTFSLDPAVLTAGEHTLVLEFRGSPPPLTRAEIGLDFIWVQAIAER